MKARAAARAAVLLSLSAGFAQAHTIVEGIGGFSGGVMHPLLVPAHVLALVALGCLTGALNFRARLVVIAMFVAVAVLSVVLVTMAFSAVNAELIVLSLAGFAGLLLAAAVPVPLAMIIVLAICVAAALTFDSVPAVLSSQDTILSLVGTILAAALLLVVITFLSASGPQVWRRIGTRILGSWIAASAIMVLALRWTA
ncbi:HupE/UreJ family protein [Pseudorhodoplanes sinuspersici]|nr:HupE/UreJ family protein [Pseudorhodoplanes sinuspersici]RKE72342.1 HupE/UreJ protein [Pseudorhodoplanes sinuspersici]